MNTLQLSRCISEDPILRVQCSGVFALDEIPKVIAGVPDCFIVNLDTRKEPGSHWIALFIDHDRNGEYFDSYGRMPGKRTIREFLDKNCNSWSWNDKNLQSPYSSACGQYCIFFLFHRVRGNTMYDCVKKFGSEMEQNDVFVTSFLNENFSVDTTVFDVEFLVNQVCRALLSS